MKPEEFIEHPARYFLHPSQIPPFEPFINYIDAGLPSDLKLILTQLLSELHSHTGQHWKPTRCHYSELIVSTLHEILPNYIERSIARQFFSGNHKWTNILLSDESSLIIDPVGLSVLQTSFSNFPYFGYLENYPFKVTGNLTYARGILKKI